MTPTTISTTQTQTPEPTGEHVFFVMAAAFTMLVIAIIAGALMPVGLAIGMIFVLLAAVVAVVAVFMNRILTDPEAPSHDS